MDNKYFPENSKKAIETLERVSQEWRQNVIKVQWKVSKPNSKLEVLIFGSAYLVMILCILWLWIDIIRKEGFQWSTSLFMLMLISPAAIVLSKAKYDSKLIIVNRKKRKGWDYPPIGGNIVNKIKYGDNYILPAFRLPENDTDGTYAQMRKELQRAITAETGWRFQDDDCNIIE